MVLANIDLMYFKQAVASFLVWNFPMIQKVNVCPTTGVERTSPIAPLPFAFGIITL